MKKILKLMLVLVMTVLLFGCDKNVVEKNQEMTSSFKKTSFEKTKLYESSDMDIYFNDLSFKDQEVLFVFEVDMNTEKPLYYFTTLHEKGYNMLSINGYGVDGGLSYPLSKGVNTIEISYSLEKLMETNIDEIKYFDVQFAFRENENYTYTDTYHLQATNASSYQQAYVDVFKTPIWQRYEPSLLIQKSYEQLEVGHVEVISSTIIHTDKKTLYLEVFNHNDFDVCVALQDFKINGLNLNDPFYFNNQYVLKNSKAIIKIPYSDYYIGYEKLLGFENIASLDFNVEVLESSEKLHLEVNAQPFNLKPLDEPLLSKENINIYLLGFTEGEYTKAALLVENNNDYDICIEQAKTNSNINAYTMDLYMTPLNLKAGSKGLFLFNIGKVQGHAYEKPSYENIELLEIYICAKDALGKEIFKEMVKIV